MSEQAAVTDDDVDLDELTEGLRGFLRSEVVPRTKALDSSGAVSEFGAGGRFRDDVLQAAAEVRQASAEAGFFTVLAPVEVGGAGLGFEALYRVWETIFEFCGSEYYLGHQAVSHWSRGPSHLYRHVDQGFRDELLPELNSGRRTPCFMMSEPDAGSDIWNMRTTATKVDGGWVLNGMKQWSTNSPYADWGIVFAVSDREAFREHKHGLTGFVIDMKTPGLTVDSGLSVFGPA